jgi:hypothetical protein
VITSRAARGGIAERAVFGGEPQCEARRDRELAAVAKPEIRALAQLDRAGDIAEPERRFSERAQRFGRFTRSCERVLGRGPVTRGEPLETAFELGHARST